MADRTSEGAAEYRGASGGGRVITADFVTRSMPESLAAEAAVLGSMIIDPECIGTVVQMLSRESFYRERHQMIYDALVVLYENRKPEVIDGILLRDQLEKQKQMDAVGGVEYLVKLTESVTSSASVKYYVEIVRQKQLLRDLIRSATEILDDAYEVAGEPDEKLDEAERKIFAIAEKKVAEGAVALPDLLQDIYTLIEKRDGSHVTGVATGYHEVDSLTAGLQDGEMIIIAARPSMGKTALVLNIAEHMGLVEKKPVAIFSLEMGRQQLAERFLCSKSGVDSQLVRKGMLNDDHYQELVDACSAYSEAPIFIDDTPVLSPLDLRAKARRLKNKHNIECIIVDYLQLMHMTGVRVESRQQEITAISRHCKALARELEVPVVMLSQLNRASEGREGHRPRMSDLRESGSIEQDADVIMLLHREDYYHRGEEGYDDDNIAEIIIAKQRNGPTGTVKLVFRDRTARFDNMSHIPEGSAPF